ncbi:hypothetical protein ROZALSC1DRAFT_21388 [Rozella allomycis CSF55]|uniref:BTB domain-containing protein n=1 Tax=Rozella allomycis (strain CSF55) TaxID=988480 RepID=A0A4P9YML9_ROZAC|nr:hypothetical protein ROZALSC1DRAFT_21388 [Rozella allomycis CSF55]
MRFMTFNSSKKQMKKSTSYSFEPISEQTETNSSASFVSLLENHFETDFSTPLSSDSKFSLYSNGFIKGAFTDCILYIQQRSIALHKIVLCQSPTFHALFNQKSTVMTSFFEYEPSSNMIKVLPTHSDIMENGIKLVTRMLYGHTVRWTSTTCTFVIIGSLILQMSQWLSEAVVHYKRECNNPSNWTILMKNLKKITEVLPEKYLFHDLYDQLLSQMLVGHSDAENIEAFEIALLISPDPFFEAFCSSSALWAKSEFRRYCVIRDVCAKRLSNGFVSLDDAVTQWRALLFESECGILEKDNKACHYLDILQENVNFHQLGPLELHRVKEDRLVESMFLQANELGFATPYRCCVSIKYKWWKFPHEERIELVNFKYQGVEWCWFLNIESDDTLNIYLKAKNTSKYIFNAKMNLYYAPISINEPILKMEGKTFKNNQSWGWKTPLLMEELQEIETMKLVLSFYCQASECQSRKE